MRIASLLALVLSPSLFAAPNEWPPAIEAALAQAGEQRAAWEATLEESEGEARSAFSFLVEHMPSVDFANLKPAEVMENVELALKVRDQVPWGQDIPDEVFLNDVLPSVNVTENRDHWRPQFVEEFLPLIAECKTPGEAAQVLNERVFPLKSVRYSTERRAPDQGPFETMESGLASCTGLSILLTDACRAACVPARLTGIASWPNKRGNHTWVEVWDAGDWHFVGAAEPSGQGLNHAWFTGDAAQAKVGSRMNGIWAVSYKKTKQTFPMVWAPNAHDIWAVEVTPRYVKSLEAPSAELCRLLVVVRDGNGNRVKRAVSCAGGGRDWNGESRDEGADTNDILAFEVPRGGPYTLTLDGSATTVEIATDQAQAEVTLTSDDLKQALEAWFAAEPNARPTFKEEHHARLLKDEAAVRAMAFDAWKRAGLHGETAGDVAENLVRWNGHESPYTLKEVGKRPEGGWPLVIAMHGGGGVPKEFNDSQWEHMQIYYKDHPEVGGYLYLALRAPNDNWNGFYDDSISGLVTQLVRNMIVFKDVDPERVSIVGYSHGGYGAFVIGPKIPHRFAAIHASASGPTPGETRAENLRNVRFTWMCGENDTAYGRIKICREFEETVNTLREGCDDCFPGGFSEQKGYGHGGLPDRDMTTQLVPVVRNPVPTTLTWRPTDGLLKDFYWLHLEQPADTDISIAKNTVTLTAGPEKVGVYLDARLVDFAKPIRLVRGDQSREVELKPSLEVLCSSLESRGDPGQAFTARIDF